MSRLSEEWAVSFKVNKLIIIDLLGAGDAFGYDANNQEINTATIIRDEVLWLNERHVTYFSYEYHKVNDKAALLDLLGDKIKKQTRQHRIIPHIHLEFHGHEDEGVSIGDGGQNISWGELNDLFIPINKNTGNNLGVFLMGCHGQGLKNVLDIDSKKTSPYGFLVYAKDITWNDVLKTRMKDFYRYLLIEKDLKSAVNVLKPEFKTCLTKHEFSCAVGSLLFKDGFGKDKDKFLEHLVTELKKGQPDCIPIRTIRRLAKARLKNLEAYYIKSGIRFLHGQKPISYDLIKGVAEELYQERKG